VQLHRHAEEIAARGADLVIIGNGSPHFARAFREDFAVTAPLYVDPSLATYRALGMRRGLLATLLSAETWKATARALRGGFRQGITRGDNWQLGGVLAVQPEGRVSYRYLSRFAGDHPPVAEILGALATAR